MKIFMKCLRSNFAVKLIAICLLICFYFGLFTMTLETNYKHFDNFLLPNVSNLIKQMEMNQSPNLKPINYYNYSFINNAHGKCFVNEEDYPLKLVLLVKSATDNFDRRDAIRKTWGFEKRFSDINIKTVFILGLPSDENVQFKINEESRINKDILQATFKDNYFNNTIKTMVAIKWAVTFCNNSKFYFFSDDDMYISVKNVLKFIRNPLEYPQYLEIPFANMHRTKVRNEVKKWPLNQVFDIELPDDTELYAGYVFTNSRPYRQYTNKWYVSLEEYPYSRYPPYVTAGSYILSHNVLVKFYYASFYVKHFRFDDIYLSFLARSSNILPLHNEEFYFYKKSYSIPGYKYVVASHGYGDPQELLKVWNEQKSAGSA